MIKCKVKKQKKTNYSKANATAKADKNKYLQYK